MHNFWSLGLKIMKFVHLWSFYQGAPLQKVLENLKKRWDEVMLPKTGLFGVQIFGWLGIKMDLKYNIVNIVIFRNLYIA